MPDYSWWHRALVLILTMREEDARRWDPSALVEFARSFRVDALGFSAGGIIAFYPTAIPFHTRSRWLGTRDLVGETVTAAHRAGMRAIGRIDPSLASRQALQAHPEWFARDAAGNPIPVHGYYVTCPNGAHYHRHIVDVVAEILGRYPLDGLWANAAKFAPWHTPQCFCASCQRKFAAEHDAPIPREDWNDPVWLRYNEWRYRCIAEWVRVIEDVKNNVRPDCVWMPLNQVGESWDFAQPGGWDIDYAAPHQDVLVLECQRRYTNVWWPGLESRYLHSLEPGKPAHVTVSYFYPWWRFYRTPVPENQVWTAQIVANGARPWLHVTGYLSEMFDRRGLDALRSLFGLLKDHPEAYEGMRSRAAVALVYSRHTLDNYGRGDAARYLDHFRGYYNAMLDARMPFDVLSDKRITLESVRRYRVLVLPNVACMSDEMARVLAKYVEGGGHLVATFETSLYDVWGTPRDDFALARVMGVHSTGRIREGLRAAYARIRDRDHPLVRDLGDTDVIPLSGSLCTVAPLDSAAPKSPLTLVPSIEGQAGSGISIPEFNQIDETASDPLVFDHPHGRGRAVYFPWQPDWLAYRYGFRDLFAVLAQAVRLAPGWEPLVEVTGPGLIDVSLMGADHRLALHLINLSAPGSFNSGFRRPMEEITPIADLGIRVRIPDGTRCRGARLIVSGEPVATTHQDPSWVGLTIRRLNEFESVLLELA